MSDGSEWDQSQGSFGWSVSDKQGTRCATGMGPARGCLPNSYRSESYGMLSILCFSFTGRSLSTWVGIIATDSESLLKTRTVEAAPKGKTAPNKHSIPMLSLVQSFPLDPLLPEWDVVRGIQVMATQMPGLALKYVAGHQDKKTTKRSFHCSRN